MVIISVITIAISMIICIKKKKFIEWFSVLYVIMPDYFAIELSQSFPLITGSRIAIGILILVLLKKVVLEHKNIILPSNWIIVLCIYASLRIIPNIYYIFTLTQAINAIFKILIEQVLLSILALNVIEKRNDIIQSICYGMGVVSTIGIFESIFVVKFSPLFWTVNRTMLDERYIRLGLLRSVFTFSMPGCFAMFLVVQMPLVIYMYFFTRKTRYILIANLALIAVIHSGSRASIVTFFIMISICFLVIKKEWRRDYLYKVIISVVCTFGFIFLLSLCSDSLQYYYVGTIKSLLNEIGFRFNLSAGAPNGVDGYGINGGTGFFSRLFQLSGIEYTLRQHPFVGLGAEAQNRWAIMYKWIKDWHNYNTYDIGYVAFIGDEGLIGFAGNMFLLIVLVFKCFRNKKKYMSTEQGFLGICIITYMICLLFTNGMNKLLWVLICVIIYGDVGLSAKKITDKQPELE